MKLFKKIQSFLSGLFLVGFNIGTGSVTAMTKAGANYNMALLWTIFLSCSITYFMIISYGRFTLITGDTALFAFKKYLHPSVGLFFIIALTVNVCGSVIGVMGIIADICHEWSKGVVTGGISPLYIAVFFILSVYLIFWKGKTQFFQKALAVIVAIMSVSFIINFFILMPPLINILKGMIPKIPNVSTDPGSGPFLVIASMVGTTVFSGLFIVRTTLVKEAGWTMKDLRTERKDAMVSTLMMFLISGTIMSAAAGTLYFKGADLSKTSQMVQLLQPFTGRFAVTIFVTGIVAAGISSQFPNVVLLPWLLCDYYQLKRDMTQPMFLCIVIIISLLGLFVPVFKAPPVVVMLASQAFGAVILPATVICIFYLSNQKRIMGEYTNHWVNNSLLVLILLFAVYMSFFGIKGLLGTLS